MRACVCAIAKDEDWYLWEWARYHLGIGFERVFVYQNDWRYSGRTLPPGTELRVLDGVGNQMKAYNDFLDAHKDDWDWCAFIDVDEFVYIRDGSSVVEFLSRYQDCPGVFLNWRFLGDSSLSFDWNNHSQVERFRRGSRTLDPCGKVIMNLKQYGGGLKMLNPHIPNLPTVDPNRKFITSDGNIRENPDEPEAVELYHYRNKTFTENFIRRFNTKDGYWAADSKRNPRAVDFAAICREFDSHNPNEVQLDGVYDRWTTMSKESQ